ncbi:MBL fold metallo-hydrolase [Aeromonas cavernicola]|uniref:MBL fold metallo-hydrolase n=1 Tax=Aeromonas cavernicola TaxID=1006623 RepID=A0A2H9U2Z0_9GAMM|nr:MBL fold metallo-hydrolase [Aeromonas cavernicola]
MNVLALAVTISMAGYAAAAPLTIEVFNPGSQSVTSVSSELIYGEKEAMLVDAQFDTKNGQALVDMVKKSGKKLTRIYISGGDPDYYFGLEPLVKAFPDVKVLASQHVVDHINKTKESKLAYWGPILGDGAPKNLIVPEVYNVSYLTLEGERIEVKEFNTPNAFLWAPSLKTAFGGELVGYGRHLWMADTPTKAERTEWVAALNNMLALNPARVIPGHYRDNAPAGTEAITFTRDYVMRFEQELATTSSTATLVEAMKSAYPDLPVTSGLELGAKVVRGEATWQ